MTTIAQQPARDFGDWFRADGIPTLIVLAVAIVVTLVARMLVRRFQRRLEGAPSLTQAINLQRITTITHTLSSAAIAGIWTVAVLIILGQFDVNLAPLLFGASIAGVALGFGAQSIVRDALSGFFILFENQFGVGDVIEARTVGGAVTGKVEGLTLRITSLRAFDGTLHIIPNGNIQFVSNQSRGWARAIVDVRVGYGENVEHVRRVLAELFEELRHDDDLRDALVSEPSVLGIETLGDYAIVVRVVAETRPSKRLDVARVLRERISRRLDERGIRIPVPPAPVASTSEGTDAPGL